MTWRLYNRTSVKQCTAFSNVNCYELPEICLKEFKHSSIIVTALRHFCRQMTHHSRWNLPTVKSVSNQPTL
jgi:hypothetical protein